MLESTDRHGSVHDKDLATEHVVSFLPSDAKPDERSAGFRRETADRLFVDE